MSSDTTEMAQQIRNLLLMPYDNGSISIRIENIQINHICEYGSGKDHTIYIFKSEIILLNNILN